MNQRAQELHLDLAIVRDEHVIELVVRRIPDELVALCVLACAEAPLDRCVPIVGLRRIVGRLSLHRHAGF